MQECYALLTNTFLKCGKELFELDTLINDISLNDENELATLLVLAEYGNAKAQYRLALRYKNGHGVTRDDAKALEWFHASATNGYACAQYMLGELYRWGQLVKLN